MRRKDREVTDIREILDILDRCSVGRLGLCLDGQPYVVPLNFIWEQKAGILRLYFHGAAEGRKLDCLRANPRACFETDIPGAVVVTPQACAVTMEYESVMAEGLCHIIENTAEKRRVLQALAARYAPEASPEIPEAVLERVAVWCFEVEKLSGKRLPFSRDS